MGNSIVRSKLSNGCCLGAARAKKDNKAVKVMKMDGKKLEFKAPVKVKEVLVSFLGSGVGIQGKVSQRLSPDHELETGKLYCITPLKNSVGRGDEACPLDEITGGASGAGRRIKVVITKQQLQQLLAKQIPVEQVVSQLRETALETLDTKWKPKLEPVLEGNE